MGSSRIIECTLKHWIHHFLPVHVGVSELVRHMANHDQELNHHCVYTRLFLGLYRRDRDGILTVSKGSSWKYKTTLSA